MLLWSASFLECHNSLLKQLMALRIGNELPSLLPSALTLAIQGGGEQLMPRLNLRPPILTSWRAIRTLRGTRIRVGIVILDQLVQFLSLYIVCDHAWGSC